MAITSSRSITNPAPSPSSFGELDVGKVGYGAPVFRGDRTVAGSVCLVLTKAQHDAADHASLVEKLIDSAAQISDAIEPRKISEPLNRSIARALT